MSIFKVALPILAALLLIVFFLGLPGLNNCALPGDKMQQPQFKKNRRQNEAIFLILLCTVYGFAAFYKLGDTKGPESFVEMRGKTAIFELSQEDFKGPARLMLFTGAGTGDYEISFSKHSASECEALLSDSREAAFSSMVFKQQSDKVLKWVEIRPESDESFKSIIITGLNGNAYLGELCLRDEGYNQIPLSCAQYPLLSDEQQLCPLYSSYMNSTYFDEIYHARTAWEHLEGIYPYEISHPPLGKIIMGIGISIFGMNPFGWRFMGCLSGVLMLPVMYFLVRRIFGSTKLAGLCSIIFASDFMHLAQTRIATIDSYAVFFILLMYLFMYGFYAYGSKWELALSGIFFGFGAASKWTCIYAGIGLALLWLMHWIFRFRAGDKKAVFKEFFKNCLFCLLFFVAIPCLIYYFSYYPYGVAIKAGPFSKEYFSMVINNQDFMLNYHVNVQAQHPYASRWYQWILDIRPILYYLQYFSDGSRSSIAAFLNPILCWGGLLSLFVVIYCAVFRRDKKAAFIIIGYLSQLVPWFFIKRLTFEYHYFPSSVFLVLGLGYVFGILRENKKDYMMRAGILTAASLVLFIMFYPVLTGLMCDSQTLSNVLGWFSSWPI